MRLIDADNYIGKVIASHCYSGVNKVIRIDDVPTVDVNNLIIKELEKIKAEIIGSCNNIAQEVSDLSYTRKIYVYEQLSEIKGAIDNHISELKGDNK